MSKPLESRTPVNDHLEGVAEWYLDTWFRSQQHDLKAKRRTKTLKQIIISAYVDGIMTGIRSDSFKGLPTEADTRSERSTDSSNQ